MQSREPLRLTRFSDRHAYESDEIETTFEDLAASLRAPKKFANKESLPLLKLARLGDSRTPKGSLRHNDNVLAITGVEGDHDAELMPVADAVALLRAANVRALIYTTASHAEGLPRWRVLAPFSAEHSPEDRARFAARLNGVLGGALAPESFTLSQAFYFGSVEGKDYECVAIEGQPLDLRDDLDAGAIFPAGVVRELRGDKALERKFTLAAVTPDTVAEVRSAVAALDVKRVDDRVQWIELGMALKSLAQAGYEVEALDMWHEASARSEKYDADDAAARWEGFRPTGSTFRSIFQWAQADGWQNPRSAAAQLETPRERAVRLGREGNRTLPAQRVMTGTEMLEELVFIADGSRVSFAADPRFTLALADMRQFTAGSVEAVPLPDGRTVKKSRLTLWLEHAERKTVKTQTFAPGKPAVCMSPKHEEAQNLWAPRERATPIDWESLSRPFFEHVAYLVPVEAERERFLDWLAHIEQAPGVLPSTHYLMVTKQTGIGRNWMAYALAQVFAGNTALGFDLGATLRSGFNGELSQTLLAVVDELHEGGPQATAKPQAEKLKSLLTEATRTINPKYGRQHVEFNACRFLMFSNHEAALPLSENDRRVIVIQNPSQRLPADYYRDLYRLLEHPRLGDAIAEALRRRDLSRFNPGEIAPMNDAKRRTIRAGRSEIEQAVRDLAAEWPGECITAGRLSEEVRRSLGAQLSSTQGAGVAAGLVKYGSRVKVAGTAHHVWILRNVDRWVGALPSEVAAEALRGAAAADAPAAAGPV